ncbi:MAG: hypothetical protein KBS39_06230 [Lachnospiraceae bacterium]|nr:hypothetical protein [Candidatus Hippenecus merdae]
MYVKVVTEKRLHEKERRVFADGREFASIITELNRKKQKYLVDPGSRTIHILEEIP